MPRKPGRDLYQERVERISRYVDSLDQVTAETKAVAPIPATPTQPSGSTQPAVEHPKGKKKPHNLLEPSEDQRRYVRGMVEAGLLPDQVAAILGIDRKTLDKHFRLELDTAKDAMVAKMAGSLIKLGLNGNVAAAIFYLKAQGGWREVQEVQVEDKGGVRLADALVVYRQVIERRAAGVLERPAERIEGGKG